MSSLRITSGGRLVRYAALVLGLCVLAAAVALVVTGRWLRTADLMVDTREH